MKTSSLMMALLSCAAMQSALAHTELSETVPSDHAMIAAAPDDVQLRFSEPVRLTALAIQRDSDSKQSLGPLPAEMTEQFSIALPVLEDGHYVVSWRALSEDTHVMTGEFMFAIGESGTHEQHMNHTAGDAGDHAAPMNHGEHGEHGAAH